MKGTFTGGTITQSTDQRKYTMVYNDFLTSPKLTDREKLVFILLKMYTTKDSQQAFPSISTLQKHAGLSRNTVLKCIQGLCDKGVISIEHRRSDNNSLTSNLYTLYDRREVWQEETPAADSEEKQIEEEKLIEILEKRGYSITKRSGAADSSIHHEDETDSPTQHNTTLHNNNNSKSAERQDRFSLQYIHDIYEYDCMVNDAPALRKEIDSIMQILYDTLNTTKPTIRVDGEQVNAMVVTKRLLSIGREEILFCISSYKELTTEVKSPRAYILTQLYHSKEDMRLKYSNMVNTMD